jgi:RNA polymerase sigma factor (sigma-70 family)
LWREPLSHGFYWAEVPTGDAMPLRFEEFFVAAEPRLRAALSAQYGADVGRDAAAEALTWAYEHWDRVRDMEHPIGYLFRVGQSRTRRQRRPFLQPVREPVEMPEVEPELERALRLLPERQRVSAVLVHGYGWSHSDVAALFGTSPSTVATHLARAIARLRELMEVELGA